MLPITEEPRSPKCVDPTILKRLSASVTQRPGATRKNLSYSVSVETLVPGRNAFTDSRESCKVVVRSFDDFRRFRKSLLHRVGSTHDPTSLLTRKSAKCSCEGAKGCPFDATRTFLERLRFSRMPFLALTTNAHEDLIKREMEINTFLRIIFAILHRMQPCTWHAECLFLQDVLKFLEVEPSCFEHIEEALKAKNRQMNLDGWKAHTLETFGSGIRV